MVSLFLSRVLGIIRESIISHQFGQSYLTDAYVLSFQIPDLLFFLIAGGALSSAFIPVFTEYLHTKSEEEAWHLFSSVASIMALLITIVIAIAWIFAPQLATVIAPTKPAETQALIAMMSQIVLPAQFAFFIGGLLFGVLYAKQIFSVPGLGPNIYNIGIIIGALVISNFVVPSVAGMSWGALIGAFVGNILIPMWVIGKMGMRYRFVLDFSHEGVRKVFRLMLPVVLGLSLPGVFALIMQYFGSFYEAGVNSALNISNRLMQAPLGVFGQSLAIGVFPALSQFFAQQRMDAFRMQLAKTLKVVLYLSVPIAGMMICAPTQIIQMFFQQGEFTLADTQRTAPALQMFAIGIPFWCMHPVLMRGYFAIQKPIIPIVFGTLTTFVFVGLGSYVVFSGGAYPLVPFAGSVAAFLLATSMLLTSNKQFEGLEMLDILKTFALTLALSAVIGVVFALILQGFDAIGMTSSKLGSVAGILIAGLVAAHIYYLLSKLLRMPESDYITKAVNRKSKGD